MMMKVVIFVFILVLYSTVDGYPDDEDKIIPSNPSKGEEKVIMDAAKEARPAEESAKKASFAMSGK